MRAAAESLPTAAPASRAVTTATLVLAALGAAYLLGGLYFALIGEAPQDLQKRWVENSYLWRHVSSCDVWDGSAPVAPDIGSSHPGCYPPWSLALSLLTAPPLPMPILRVYFTALNLAALWIVLRYAQRLGARFGTAASRLLAAAALAIAANAIVFRHGQFGIFVNAFLILMLGAMERTQPVRGGIYLALAALKPQTAGPFALAWLRREGLVALLVCGACTGAAAALASLWLDRSPLYLVSQAFGHAANWEGGDAGVLRLLLATGLPRGAVIPGLMALGLASSALLAFRYRARSPLVQAAIFAVIGRLWTYHRRYDDMMLVFLLLALGETALRTGKRSSWLTFTAAGLTLWLPFREEDHTPFLIAVKVSVWIYGLVELLRREPAATAQNATSA